MPLLDMIFRSFEFLPLAFPSPSVSLSLWLLPMSFVIFRNSSLPSFLPPLNNIMCVESEDQYLVRKLIFLASHIFKHKNLRIHLLVHHRSIAASEEICLEISAPPATPSGQFSCTEYTQAVKRGDDEED